MTKTIAPGWSEAELGDAASELAREYPTVSLKLITMVVGIAQYLVSPQKGRVALLSMARKSLHR